MSSHFTIITILAAVCILPFCSGCTCPVESNPHVTPREEIFCRSHHVIKGKLLTKRVGEHGMIDYTLIVLEVYRGPPGIAVGNAITYKSTGSSMQCGVTNLEVDVTYIIAGNPPYPDFGYGLTICQWVQEYNDLSSEVKKGLRRKYQRSCPSSGTGTK